MARAVIIIPQLGSRYATEGCERLSSILPVLGAEYLKLYAEEKGDHEVEVIYEDLEPAGHVRRLIEREPSSTLIGYSLTSMLYSKSVVDQMELAHRRGMRVVLGGPHVRLASELILRFRPYALCAVSWGEETILKLLDGAPLHEVPGLVYRERGKLRRTEPKTINYEELPLINPRIPHERFFERWLRAYETYGMPSRLRGSVSIRGIQGCAKPKVCSFCSVEHMEKHNPASRARRIVEEREDAIQRWGANIFIRECNDDLPPLECLTELKAINKMPEETAIYNNGRITELLREGRAELVKAAGYTDILVGLEALSDAGLQYTGKSRKNLEQLFVMLDKTNDVGLGYYISVIVGWPGEDRSTYKEMKETMAALLEYDSVKSMGLGNLMIYPYTDLFNRLMEVPGMKAKHLDREDGDVLDYYYLFEDWLRTFSPGVDYDAVQEFLDIACREFPKTVGLSGFVKDEQLKLAS
jgi:radical SAM superfamily enzyme YgiQ (UPF0313 family)